MLEDLFRLAAEACFNLHAHQRRMHARGLHLQSRQLREDFIRILTEPENALTRQYVALMETENVHLTFTGDAVAALAEIAAEVNSRSENIGARRLHTVLERLLEELSFSAPELTERTVTVDSEYVHRRLDPIVKNEDLSRYIL